MILFSHPTGNANVRALLQGLEEAGLLEEFHTSLTSGVGLSGKFLKYFLRQQASRRRFPVATQYIRTHPLHESIRLLANTLSLKGLTHHESGWASIDSVYRNLDHAVARTLRKEHRWKGVYAFEDGALESFRVAKRRGIPCLYELPIAYWRLGRKIHMEEAQLQPAWAMTLDGLQDSDSKLRRKDEEIALADILFCASSFTKRSIERYPGVFKAPIQVVPYGGPAVNESVFLDLEEKQSQTREKLPLRLIFVGGLSQRKGLSYLFDAVNRLGKAVQLTIIGRYPKQNCPALNHELANHRHIDTLPHPQVLEEMRRADAFVFPSLFEGFGLVLLEAMSQGLPCITTPHTAGPDFMSHGKDGFIVPIRDTDSLVEKIEYLHDHREELLSMKKAALITANEQSWDKYTQKMVHHLRAILD